MEPDSSRAFPPAQAGAFLIVVTLAVIGVSTLIGWIFDAVKAGLLVGVVLGVPVGIGGVYFRYRGAFT
jgi:hypothetical protein